MYLLISMQILLASTAVLLPQDKHDLKRLLTAAEWRTLVGEDDTGLDLDVVVPQFPLQDRQRRSSDFRKFMYINAPKLLQNFQLDLTLTQNLLDPNFVMLNRWENRTDILPSNLVDMECYYRSEGVHRAALSVCGGVRGIITSQHDEYFIINPFPQRFHKRSTQHPHLIVRKKFTNENKSFNLVSKTAPSPIINNITMKNAHNFNLFDSLRSDLFNLRDSSKSLDSVINKYNCGNKHFESRKREDVTDRSARSNRIPRSYSSSDSPVYVETAVFVDRDLYQHMSLNFPTDTEQEVVRFVLAMVNAVQLLYHDQSLGRPVSFVMKRLEILHTDPGGLRRSHDIDRFLGNFCAWQGDENPPNDSDPLHWDHALILTGLDLYVLSKNGKVSSQVVGLAPVAGMCTATSSCTVNEGRHFESAYVVAHEIGHNLGMRHDGPLADNNCDPGSYIMSPTLGSGKITWSSCSKRYLQEFLMTPQSHCLMDHSVSAGQIDHSENGALPGERFNANQQCMLKYGPGSHHAMSQPLHDLCRDLHCRRERYTWTSHPALEGTNCGTNKWCRSGRCVPRGLSAIQADEAIHGGWSTWGHFSDCASACLHVEGGGLGAGSTGVMVAARRCNNPRPENGGVPCVGSDRKYRTCVANQCENVPHMTIRDFADEVCLRAREVDSELVGTGLQKMSVDAEEACTIWCYKRNGGYKSRGWTFPDGTTCKTQQSQASEFCISGVCQDFSCERGNGEDGPFKLSSEMCLFSRDKRREVAVGFWVAASDCFFNCITPGSGIRVVEKRPCRHCNSSASIQLCKLENPVCSKLQSTLEFATSVCTKYSERVRRLSGLGMQLSPSLEDPDRACRIACQDENVLHRFYLVNGEDGWFPFGSDCSRGDATKKAFCIRGKCLEFGSDDTPLHESEYTLHSVDTKKLYKEDSRRRRRRRTLEQQPSTVTMMLDDQTLKQIIATINNSDISTKIKKHLIEEFPIDLENPVFVQTTDWKWLSYRHNEVDANSFL